MKTNDTQKFFEKQYSRRNFLTTLGAATAGVLFNPLQQSKHVLASTHRDIATTAQVAVTQGDNYDRTFIKQKVQHLFEALGGIGDVLKTGDKVAIKINLTGGSSYTTHNRLRGENLRDVVWTHPEVLRAVGELIIDSGVSAENLYFVEAIWDSGSYNNYGYLEVQQDLGAQLVNLNSPEPYSDFMDKEVNDHFYYSTLKFNRILDEVDVFVSISKMKQHYNAAVTHSMKNLVGLVPLQHYIKPGMNGYRSALHFDGGDIKTHLPRSVCDLNLARPIHLAVVDGVKNADGGEGPWNSTFKPAAYNLLFAGKDPVATDSVASLQMGDDPEAEKLQAPNRDLVDNYLYLAHQKGMGTNVLDEIGIVGDGAAEIKTDVQDPTRIDIPNRITLFQNYPNPFNATTTIRYYLPKSGRVSLKMFNVTGQEIETLVNHYIPAGEHQLHWTANNLPSGMYYYRLCVGDYVETRKLVLQK